MIKKIRMENVILSFVITDSFEALTPSTVLYRLYASKKLLALKSYVHLVSTF